MPFQRCIAKSHLVIVKHTHTTFAKQNWQMRFRGPLQFSLVLHSHCHEIQDASADWHGDVKIKVHLTHTHQTHETTGIYDFIPKPGASIPLNPIVP